MAKSKQNPPSTCVSRVPPCQFQATATAGHPPNCTSCQRTQGVMRHLESSSAEHFQVGHIPTTSEQFVPMGLSDFDEEAPRDGFDITSEDSLEHEDPPVPRFPERPNDLADEEFAYSLLTASERAYIGKRKLYFKRGDTTRLNLVDIVTRQRAFNSDKAVVPWQLFDLTEKTSVFSHPVGTTLSTFGGLLSKTSPLFDKTFNWIVRLAAYRKLMIGKKTTGERLAATYLLYEAIVPDEAKRTTVLHHLFESLAMAYELAVPDLTPMSGVGGALESADGVLDAVTNIKNHSVTREVQKILTCISVHLAVGNDKYKTMEAMGLLTKVDTADWISSPNMVEVGINLCRSTIKLIRCACGMESEVASVCDVETFVDAVDWLTRFENRRSDNPTGSEVHDGLWVDRLVALTKKRHTIVPNRSTSYLFNSACRNLDSMYLTQMSKDHASRGAPFVFALLGAPGTGKTDVVGRLWQKQALHGLGFPATRKDFSTSLNGSDQYLAGYDPNIHSAVVWDEAGGADPKYSESIIPGHFLSMCSGGSLPLNSAELSQKGRRFFRPKVFMVCSNYDHMGLDDYVRNKGAIYRRFAFAFRLTVRSEFKNATSEGIDAMKVAEYCKKEGLEQSTFLETVKVDPMVAGESGWLRILPKDQYWTVAEATQYVEKKAQEHRARRAVDTNIVSSILECSPCACGVYMCSAIHEPVPDEDEAGPEESVVDTKDELVPMSGGDVEMRVRDRVHLAFSNLLGFFCMYFLQFLILGLFSYIIWVYPRVFAVTITFLFIASSRPVYTHVDRHNKIATFWELLSLRSEVYIKAFLTHCALIAVPGLRREYFKRAKRGVERLMASRNVQLAVVIGLLSAVLVVLYKLRQAGKDTFDTNDWYWAPMSDPNSEDAPRQGVREETPPSPVRRQVGAPPIPFTGRRNVWRSPDIVFELGRSAGDPLESIRNRLMRNLRFVKRRIKREDGNYDVETFHVLGIRSCYAICPWHSVYNITEKSEFQFLVPGENGPLVTHVLYVYPKQIKRISNDLAIVDLRGKPFVDISLLLDVSVDYAQLPNRSGYTGFFSEDLGTQYWCAISTVYRPVTYDAGTDHHTYDAHVAKLPALPYHGQCGSFYLIEHNRRHGIAGVFIAGSPHAGWGAFAPVTLSMVNEGIDALESNYVMLRPLSSNVITESPTLSSYVSQMTVCSQPKNHIAWIPDDEMGGIEEVGSLHLRPQMRSKSQVIHLPVYEDFHRIFPSEFHPNLFTPRLHGCVREGIYYSPEKHALADLATTANNIDPDDLDAVRLWLIEKFSTGDFTAESVIDSYSAVSGSRHSTLVSSIKKTTGAGFPFFKKKKDLLEECPTDQAPNGYRLTDECQSLVDDYIDKAEKGIRYDVIGVSCPKDEPVKKEKADTARSRIFIIGPMHYFIVCKMFLGTFLSMFSLNFHVTETVGGVNMFSSDWGDIYARLSKHPRVVNGDFSRYDKKLDGHMMMVVFDIILNVKRRFRHVDAQEEAVIRAIATDVAFPYVLMGDDVLSFPGSLSSGVLMTFHVNNIANSIYIRLVYLKAYRSQFPGSTRQEALAHFEDNVVFYALGDDNTYSISEEALKFFNFPVAQELFAQIGIKYTLADKSSDSYGSVPVSEATIGKRRFVPDETGYITCPIELPTIGKILTFGLNSGPLSAREKQMECFHAAALELSQYPREFYDTYKAKLLHLAQLHDFRLSLPSWNEQKERQWNNTEAVDTIRAPVELEPMGSHPLEVSKRLRSSVTNRRLCTFGMPNRLSPPLVATSCGRSILLPRTIMDSTNNTGGDLVHNPIATITEEPSAGLTQQTVTFSPAENIYRMDMESERDETYNVGHSEDVPLGEFLTRPISLVLPNDAWNAFSYFKEEFDPWVLWQNDPRIHSKLSNYAYASFDLHLRILLNSTPFHYGKLMVIYIPYGNHNEVATHVDSVIYAADPFKAALALQYFSTYPHAVITAGDNNEVEMVLPFVYHHNFFPLCGSSGVTRGTCGKILILSLNQLAIANTTAVQTVYMTAYAWASNIRINTPTELVPMSKSSTEADSDGKISVIATSVANAAGHLRRVPVIGPFATVTEMVARTSGKVAALFGFSSPQMGDQVRLIAQRSAGKMANIIGGDTSVSLAFDPKQGITVDPRTVGVRPFDEMTFKSIVTREQWITKAPWRKGVGVFVTSGAEPIIFASVVNPSQIRSGDLSDAADNHVGQTTPAGHIARCFRYWNGSVTYRVQVVASQYHSGRLLLQYDPLVTDQTITISDLVTTDVNGRHSMVLDLQDAHEIEFTIEYKSYRPWLETRHSEAITFQPQHTSDGNFTLLSQYSARSDTGMFIITVLNDLVAPMDTDGAQSSTKASVDVNIYVRSEEDMEFCQPDEYFTNLAMLPKLVAMSGSSVEAAHWDENTLVPSENSSRKTQVFFGESVVSVRSFLKRYNLHQVIRNNKDVTGSGTPNENYWTQRKFPHFPMSREHTAHSDHSKTPSIAYFAGCYLIQRGATRFKAFVINGDHSGSMTYNPGAILQVERCATSSAVFPYGGGGATIDTGTDAGLDVLVQTVSSGALGADSWDATSKLCVEWESPFYSNTRFALGTQLTVVEPVTQLMVMNPAMDQILYSRIVFTGRNTCHYAYAVYTAAGEDYSLSWFLAPPPVYY